MRTLTYLIVICQILSGSLAAQGWQNRWKTNTNNSTAYHLLQLPDKGFLVTGSEERSPLQGHRDILISRFTEAGDTLWTSSFGDKMISERGVRSEIDADGNIVTIGWLTDNRDTSGIFMAKLDPGGKLLEYNRHINEGYNIFRDVILLDDGSLVACGMTNNPGTNRKTLVYKISREGDLIWEHQIDSSQTVSGPRQILRTSEDRIIVTASGSPRSTILIGFNISDGEQRLWKMLDIGTLYHTTLNPQNNLVALTLKAPENFISEIDENGDIISNRLILPINGSSISNYQRIASTGEGGYLLQTIDNDPADPEQTILIEKRDENLSTLWIRSFGFQGSEQINYITAFPDSTAAMVGSSDFQSYIITTDGSGLSSKHYIQGHVFLDFEEDCTYDGTEQTVPSSLLSFVNTDTIFSSADSEGFYNILLNVGDYEVSSIFQHNNYWKLCPEQVITTLDSTSFIQDVDFGLQPEIACADLWVDMGLLTPLRPCFPLIYTINYCNYGTIDAADAYLTLQLDEAVIVDSSSVDMVNMGNNSYQILIGDVAPFQCEDFQIFGKLDCDAEVGQTHCSSVLAFPDTICAQPDTVWSRASITLEANCADSIRFSIINTGTEDMIQSQDYMVIIDDVILREGSYQLQTGQQMALAFEADGSTYRLETAQVPGHPGKSRPSTHIEGCGDDITSHLGHVIPFPEDDADNFVDILCEESTNSYDPNDKNGFPFGYRADHMIYSGQEIDYVLRFQNIGTAPAINVLIRDTLSAWFDPASIVPGTSSHDYKFELKGKGIVEYYFENIMLSDSLSDPEDSQGFVKFTIQQRPDLPLGTRIENQAAIYFDFNEPIFTNTTWHTLGDDFIERTVVSVDEVSGKSLHIYPNPFAGQTRFDLSEYKAEKVQIRMFDLNGRLLRSIETREEVYELDGRGLPGGLLIYEVEAAGVIRHRGKLIHAFTK